ncbi:MAG TPA: hypothetical protein VI997_08280 [Candidatus Thermoplasmatota archaeon]|nr:hypothetical protein [Candidatus Thermoplasmatota archaeon]
MQRALADGKTFVQNAKDELDRKILREDQLYFIDNQVEALDTFLADTEDVGAQSPELGAVRTELRGLKQQLERKSMEFLAKAEGQELPEDLPPEEMAGDMAQYGAEFVTLADEALKQKLVKVDQVGAWEDPLATINSFLADSEPFVHLNKALPKVRGDLKDRKRELEKRIQDLIGAWRQADLAGGDEDDE